MGGRIHRNTHEGSTTKTNVIARQIPPIDMPEKIRNNFMLQMEDMGRFNKRLPRFHAINCWHMNEHESAAMWKLYLKSDEGIAIQSTYKKLKKSLIDEESIYVGVVKYIDYESELIDAGNLFTPFLHKRKSFEHEREVRCITAKWPPGPDTFSTDSIDSGLYIRIDIETLVEKIYIAPSAPDWFTELIKAVVNQYGYSFLIAQSKLDEQPVF